MEWSDSYLLAALSVFCAVVALGCTVVSVVTRSIRKRVRGGP